MLILRIKRLLCSVLAVFLIAAAPTVYAEEDVRVFLNGAEIEFDQPPVIFQDLTFVPFRAVFQALGMVVQWHGDTATAAAFDEAHRVAFRMGYDYVFINDMGRSIPHGPIIENSRMLVPLRALGEALDADVLWDGDTRRVYISTEYAIDNENRALRVFELTNEARRQYGLRELSWSDELAEVGRVHCMDMAAQSYFDHVAPDGTTPSQRVRNAGIRCLISAENIAAGQINPEMVVQSWLDSPGHRANILDPQLGKLGVAFFLGGDYGIYWAQEFTD